MINKSMPGLWQWNIFWWKIEGYAVLNGINIYPLTDKDSAGFVIRVHNFKFQVRWSKRVKRWFIYYAKRNVDGYWPSGTYLKGWDK